VSALSLKNETLVLQISKSRINEKNATLENLILKKNSIGKSSKAKDNLKSQITGGSRANIFINNYLEKIKMDQSVLVK
jgi:hypothetical protein